MMGRCVLPASSKEVSGTSAAPRGTPGATPSSYDSPHPARHGCRITDRAAAEEALRTAGPPDRQGRTTLTLPVESEDVAYSQLLTLGPEVEILQPASLRHRFADAATRMAGLYR